MSCLILNVKRKIEQHDTEGPVDSKSVCRSPLKWKFVELLLPLRFLRYIDSATLLGLKMGLPLGPSGPPP